MLLVDSGENGESWDKTEPQSSTEKLGIMVYEENEMKSSSKNSNNSLVQTSSKIVTQKTQLELSKGEQRRVTILELPMMNLTKLVKNEHREKSPGVGDFFLIDDDNIPHKLRNRHPVFYPLTIIVLMMTTLCPKEIPKCMYQ